MFKGTQRCKTQVVYQEQIFTPHLPNPTNLLGKSKISLLLFKTISALAGVLSG